MKLPAIDRITARRSGRPATRPQWRTDVEQAVSVLRALLAAATVMLMAGRAIAHVPFAASVLLTPGAAALGGAGAWWAGHRVAAALRKGRRGALTALQAIDAAFFVAVALALHPEVPDAAWAVLMLPLIVGSLRAGEWTVLATWAAVVTGYTAAGQVLDGAGAIDFAGPATSTERAAALLVVAACIALLTRWLQDGWRIQAELTRTAERRAERLAVLERAGQRLRATRADDMGALTLSLVRDLGFGAATITRDGAVVAVDGDATLVPGDVVPLSPLGSGVEVTAWTGPGGRVVSSASVLEPHSAGIVSGWSDQPVDDDTALALHALVTTASEVIEAGRHLARIRHEATHDPLTGLLNRAELLRVLEQCASRPEAFTVAFIDVDRFKSINDTYGHLAGDELLRALAGRLRGALGRLGTAGRYGGDELVAVVTSTASTSPEAIGERIRACVEQPFRLDGTVVDVSLSIGLATAAGPVALRDVLERADAAVYQAKAEGRDRYVVAAPAPDGPPDSKAILSDAESA